MAVSRWALASYTVTKKTKKITKRKKTGNVPSAVAQSILRVASVLAAVDGVYKDEEKKKLREVAKLFPSARISQSELVGLDKGAERISKLYAKGASVSDAFSTTKTGIDMSVCLGEIAKESAWVYSAMLVWLAICCCDSGYCAIERKVVAKIRDVLAREYKIAMPDTFVKKAELHLQNLTYAELHKAEIEDPFRKENLKDVIDFEKALLTRMAAGKEF